MEIKTIGVIGAGQMGSGIAQIAASSGYQVLLYDLKREFCDRALEKIQKALEKRVAAGKLSAKDREDTLARLTPTVELADMKGCDMVIESAIEVMESKQEIFEKLSGICRSDAIFCTNTSSLSITRIMERAACPERCAGMHFFFPATTMKLVEMIRSKSTSDATIDAIREVSSRMGKTAVECRTDTPGFIVNRCLFAFLMEAVHCYEDGVASTEDIDAAIKLGLNHPMGPFELLDMSGMDTFVHIAETLQALPVTSWDTPKSVQELVESGKYGQKTREGWYKY